MLVQVTKEEFDAVLNKNKLARPDGFKIVGGFVQTKWRLDGKEIARQSTDSFGTIFEAEKKVLEKIEVV